MFARKKRNKSGSITVQIVDKSNGYRIVQTIGTSADPNEIGKLFSKAKKIIHAGPADQPWLLPPEDKEEQAVDEFLKQLTNSQIRTIGPELIFGTLFDRIGFGSIEEELFRHLTIGRLAFPVSKLKTTDYLRRYRGIEISEDTIYRFMDKLNSRYRETVSAISYEHTKRRLGKISFVFYDMTTLYFEAEDEDDLRKIGFSKDGKFQKPQIMLGLLVGTGGLPIGYDIFEGNTFEGHTLIPVLTRIQAQYGFDKPVVVADAALLSTDNLKNLVKEGYSFIIGARIKNEKDVIKEKILTRASGMVHGESFILKKKDGTRLVVTYSEKRAKKDAANRQRGVEKLRKQIKSGRLSKQNIHNRGYNRFLTLTGEARVRLDEKKVEADSQWDGLKGYATNTLLSAKEVADNYIQLWQIENAFRISKTDLRIRPVHHYLRRRIEAHICIAFVAYAIYRELEFLLKTQKISMTPKRAAELTQNMYAVEYSLPNSHETKQQILKMDSEQQALFKAIHPS